MFRTFTMDLYKKISNHIIRYRKASVLIVSEKDLSRQLNEVEKNGPGF